MHNRKDTIVTLGRCALRPFTNIQETLSVGMWTWESFRTIPSFKAIHVSHSIWVLALVSLDDLWVITNSCNSDMLGIKHSLYHSIVVIQIQKEVGVVGYPYNIRISVVSNITGSRTLYFTANRNFSATSQNHWQIRVLTN